MTSIEWLEEQFKKQRFIEKIDFEKAKEMHKQELADFLEWYINLDHYHNDFNPQELVNEYYNETFKNNI